MFVIVGRSAMNHNMNKIDDNTDLDVWDLEGTKCLIGTFQQLDRCEMPQNIMDAFSKESKDTHIATFSDLLAIKLSHMQYDIFWKKHKQDVLFLNTKTTSYNVELYKALVEHWKKEFGTKDYLSLYRTKDKFFDDFVPKEFEHDYLHELVSSEGIPVYTKCLKDGQEVFIDKNKFDNLDFCDRIRMFKEEIAVIALERWVIPSIKRGGEMITISEAWNRSLHKTVTSLTKGWASEFIVLNLEMFLNPLYNEMLSALAVLNLKEKYMSKQISIEEFKALIDSKVEYESGENRWVYDWKDVIHEGAEGIEIVDQEGGGEGGAEDCFTVLKIDDVFYRVNYSYYSHHGYEFEYATVQIVTPQQKMVTVYE